MIKSENKKLTCPECKNQFDVEAEVKEGDVVECPFCGIELEVMKKDENGEVEVEIIEGQK